MFGTDSEESPGNEEFRVKRLTVQLQLWVLVALVFQNIPAAAQDGNAQLEFGISFDHLYSKETKSGTLYLLLSSELNGEPRLHMNQGHFQGFIFSYEFEDLAPDQDIVFNSKSLGYPGPLADLKPGRYAIQAILDVNPTKCDPSHAHNNGVSFSKRLELNPKTSGHIDIVIQKELLRQNKPRRQRVNYEYIESRLVGRQIGSRFFVNASVVMPINYTPESKRRYPVQYWFADLGENTRSSLKYFQKRGLYAPMAGEDGRIGKEFIFVLIDSTCRNGYHGWVDSPNNGSFRKALYREILPFIESHYPIDDSPSARFLVGKGAGGLAALNILIDRPDYYAAAWALAPDPVDFHDYFGLDLYAKPLPNAFVDAAGQPRSLLRQNGKTIVTFEEQVRYETVVRTGNLLQSYNAAFGGLGKDLQPARLVDPKTGNIDEKVAARFRRHDFSNRIQKNWSQIAVHLDGKINIIVGDADDLDLDRPVARLKALLDKKHMKNSIEIVPQLNHAGVDDRKILLGVQRSIMALWLRESQEKEKSD